MQDPRAGIEAVQGVALGIPGDADPVPPGQPAGAIRGLAQAAPHADGGHVPGQFRTPPSKAPAP